MGLRAGLFVILAWFLTNHAIAAEQIDSFEVVIDVATDGDISVTETITVTSEGNQIRRGIFRDLPRYYTNNGARFVYDYEDMSVLREGRAESYTNSTDGSAVRIRIGDAEVFLRNGKHLYEIKYRVKNQVRYFSDYDEIYWNVTGSYWAFPINSARATINLPPGAEITGASGYTGASGQSGTDYSYNQNGNAYMFRTTKPLRQREGLTVALGFNKGLIDPPSASDKRSAWWQRYGAIAILIGSLLGLTGYYYRSFDRVGRDPAKGPVFPRYAPPKGYSPAAVHQVYYRVFSGHKALIATLMYLGTKDRMSINATSKITRLSRKENASADAVIAAEDIALEQGLFNGKAELVLGKKYDADFTRTYKKFKSNVSKAYGDAYFKWNLGYVFIAILATGLAVFFAIAQATVWSTLHTLAVLGLAVLNGLFIYLMPAPTIKGQAIRTAIEGFKLYLETAEKLQLNAVKVGSDVPPPMTTERYEKFLPYAVALGVEQPWTRHFERLIPEEAENYSPQWSGMRAGRGHSLHGLNKALVANINSGVTSALPQSSSSSGSGGGGSSGGGGGGGGGGGW